LSLELELELDVELELEDEPLSLDVVDDDEEPLEPLSPLLLLLSPDFSDGDFELAPASDVLFFG
jgi:hypothetical protein